MQAEHRACSSASHQRFWLSYYRPTTQASLAQKMVLHPLRSMTRRTDARRAPEQATRTLRPPYAPGGFCVANSMKCGCGLICAGRQQRAMSAQHHGTRYAGRSSPHCLNPVVDVCSSRRARLETGPRPARQSAAQCGGTLRHALSHGERTEAARTAFHSCGLSADFSNPRQQHQAPEPRHAAG